MEAIATATATFLLNRWLRPANGYGYSEPSLSHEVTHAQSRINRVTGVRIPSFAMACLRDPVQ